MLRSQCDRHEHREGARRVWMWLQWRAGLEVGNETGFTTSSATVVDRLAVITPCECSADHFLPKVTWVSQNIAESAG